MEEMLKTEVHIEIYLEGRTDPIHAAVSCAFKHDEAPRDVEELTDYVTQIIGARMDSKSTPHLVCEDLRHTKVVVVADKIEGLTILAPDDLPWEWNEVANRD